MDPIGVLQNRIEQLEAKLGMYRQTQADELQHQTQKFMEQKERFQEHQDKFEHQQQQFVQQLENEDHQHQGQPQGDNSVAANLLNAADTIKGAVPCNKEQLNQAMARANELNNYMDPNATQQQPQVQLQELVAGEPQIRQHHVCMHHLKQAAPVMGSEAFQRVPQNQVVVDQMRAATEQHRTQAAEVNAGVQQVAETCGDAANAASENLAAVAKKVERVEEALTPRRRNGLD